MGGPRRGAAPEPARYLLDTADDQALVRVAVGHDDPEDLQHGVGKVRVPAAGAEPDLAEDLAVAKRELRERLRGRDEVVKRPVIPAGHRSFHNDLSAATSRARIAFWMSVKRTSSRARAQASATLVNSGGSSPSEPA